MNGISHAVADLTGTGVGLGVALGASALVGAGLHRAGETRLGPANTVTAGRTALVAVVTGLAVRALIAGEPVPSVVVPVAAVALALDGVDGFVARRTGTASALGARFDMEVDALLILVLSAVLVPVVGWWVLAIGLMRYAFVAAAGALPWLLRPLPPRFSRKVVAAAQGVALVVAISGVLPEIATTLVLVAALASLTWSFGRDVRWLTRTRRYTAPVVRQPVLTSRTP